MLAVFKKTETRHNFAVFDIIFRLGSICLFFEPFAFT